MRNIRLTIAYDGTRYQGWQRQDNGPTIQGALEERLQTMTREEVFVNGAGRTDSGVHARAMVANFKTACRISPTAFCRGLNSMLAKDIRILTAEEVQPDFHARFDACAKTYSYRIDTSNIQLPHLRLYRLHVPFQLDLAAMEECLTMIKGEHDFASFEAAGSRDPNQTTGRGSVRTILQAGLQHEAQGRLRLRFTGDGFLRHMVRNLAGTLLDVGKGRTSLQEFGAILAAADRSRAGATAPAHGLFLEQVHYSAPLPASSADTTIG